MTPEQRIAKLLARAGVASRREVERMIAEGRIALNGVAIDTPATLLSSLDGVTVDGQPVAAPEPTRLFLYHKPNGLLVTERDPKGRPTIYDRLPAGLPRVVPVGRLDLNTEGLLLLTTDGGFKRQLELPATGVERTYRARAYGDVSQAQLEELIHGIEIDGVRYGQIDANLERRTGANVWIEMTLREGKNREVRRVLEHLGLQVSRLIRLRYGPFVLDELPVGEVGEVRGVDIVEFRKTLAGGIPADAIKPAKPKPGFRTPPARTPAERPARTATDAPAGGTTRRPHNAVSDRPRSPERKPSGERLRREDGRSSTPFAKTDRPGRPRQDAKPYSKGAPDDRAMSTGQRSTRLDDGRSPSPFATNERSGRARPEGKPFARDGKAQGFGRSDDRGERTGRPVRGPQSPSGRNRPTSTPDGPGGRPRGGGRSGRQGGRR